jgi:hypothetical protein
MARKRKAPVPASQEEVNEIMDSYGEMIATVADLFCEARRVGDNARCESLWEYAQYLMWKKRQDVLAAICRV